MFFLSLIVFGSFYLPRKTVSKINTHFMNSFLRMAY